MKNSDHADGYNNIETSMPHLVSLSVWRHFLRGTVLLLLKPAPTAKLARAMH